MCHFGLEMPLSECLQGETEYGSLPRGTLEKFCGSPTKAGPLSEFPERVETELRYSLPRGTLRLLERRLAVTDTTRRSEKISGVRADLRRLFNRCDGIARFCHAGLVGIRYG